MAGRYKDIPPNIQKWLEALFGISPSEWRQVSKIVNDSFDRKMEEAEKGFRLASEEDIHNTLFLRF